MTITIEQSKDLKVLVSSLAAKQVLAEDISKSLVSKLKEQPDVFALALGIAKTFDNPKLTRSLNLSRSSKSSDASLELHFQGSQVHYQGQIIGQTKILFKSPLPGELQARLAIESAIDRFLKYLQKVYQIVALDESDRHVQFFIPKQLDNLNLDFEKLWQEFINKVAFSTYGMQKFQLSGLVQTFVLMLKSIKLSDRGFSTLEIPVINREQSIILASWYFAVWRETKKRQDDRQRRINNLRAELENSSSLTEKEYQAKEKQLRDAEETQLKEENKYTENFLKSFGKSLEEQKVTHMELSSIQSKLSEKLSKANLNKLHKQREKLLQQLCFSQESLVRKFELLQESEGNPLDLVSIDLERRPDRFTQVVEIAKNFDKTATDQIAGVKGDIFAKCVTEMYRLLEMEEERFDSPPPPLLTEEPIAQVRSPGDDSKEFCYACGVAIDPKPAKWEVRRFIFESPEQRSQSASSQGRPHICASCSALSFASPLKLSDESIILRLEHVDISKGSNLTINDYLRMLANKEMHLSAGRFIVLSSEKNQKGDSAAKKMGQVQYALAKVSSIFPIEVLADFRFYLVIQGGDIKLATRHLLFIKGLMDCYGQPIIIAGKDFNLSLGDAIRYIQQDLPYLADYTVTKIANFSQDLELEKIRNLYWEAIQTDLKLQGDSMDSNTQLSKRAKLYRDVAALTGLTYAFASSMEVRLKGIDEKEREREISKLIEQVEDANFFCYYATLGVETTVQARLWYSPNNYFIYEQTKNLLLKLDQVNREETDEAGKTWLQLYADDINRAYAYFAENGYASDKEWKELTYQLKLSLYTRFPELVRKQKTTGEKS